jgi:hypothetical protein
LQRSQRSQSIMSSVSLQDSQLQFYDAIEYFTTDTESDDDSDQDSDADGADTSAANRTIKAAPAIVPGKHFELNILKFKIFNDAKNIFDANKKRVLMFYITFFLLLAPIN